MMISSGGRAIIIMISGGGRAIIIMISGGGRAIIIMISGGSRAIIIMISGEGRAIISRRVGLHVRLCGVRQEAVLVQTRPMDYHWLGWRSLSPQMRDVFTEDALQRGEFDTLHPIG